MIKLILADVDGTLLNNNKCLGHNFWDIEAQLADKGILFSVASARQYYNLIEKFEKIKERTIFIAENGTYAVYQGKQLHLAPLHPNLVSKYLNIARKIEGTHLILCGKETAYVESSNSKFLARAQKFFAKLQPVNDLMLVNDEILKISLCHFKGAARNTLPHFQQFEGECKMGVAGKIWLELSDITANKGNAIRKIQQALGITYDETMVFGDYLNDLEMMRAGKHSYAMKNAHPDIIAAATFVTLYDNNNNGVMRTIQKVIFND